MKTFAVTGEHLGSIVEAISEEKAIEIFMQAWDNEKVLVVKDISNSNLDNLYMGIIPTGRGSFIVTSSSSSHHHHSKEYYETNGKIMGSFFILNSILTIFILCRFLYLKYKGEVRRNYWGSAFENYITDRCSFKGVIKIFSIVSSGLLLCISIAYLFAQLIFC